MAMGETLLRAMSSGVGVGTGNTRKTLRLAHLNKRLIRIEIFARSDQPLKLFNSVGGDEIPG